MTQITKRIRYSPESLSNEFQEIFNNFSGNFQGNEISRLLGENLVKEIETKLSTIQSKLERELSIVVAGDFKRGKSTFINALLKKQVVTTNVTPETVTINEIKYGSELKIDACLEDGGRINLEPEELRAEKLTPLLTEYPNKINHLTIETPLEYLQQKLCLVDTPGTGDILKQFDSKINAYLSKADVVLWVTSASFPLTESEETFLRLSLAPQNFAKLFFIVNRIDDAPTDIEAEKLLNYAIQKISRIFPNAQIFGVSALDEFNRIQSLPRQNPTLTTTLDKSFQTFRDCLQETVILNQDLILIQRATVQMTRLLQVVESKIFLLSNAMRADKLRLQVSMKQYEDDTSNLYQEIDKYKQEMREKISQLREQSLYWMDEFIRRLETKAIASISNFDLNEIRSNFHFFLTDKLRQAIDKCLNVHQPVIIKIAEKTKTSIFEAIHNLTDITSIEVDLDSVKSYISEDITWTNIDTLNLLINEIGIDEIPQLLTNIFTHQKTESEKSKGAITYREKLQEYIPELKNSIMEKITGIYAQITTKIEKQIEQAYQEEIAASLAAMKQAQQISISGEEKMFTTNEDVQIAISLVKNTRSELQPLREKLRVGI